MSNRDPHEFERDVAAGLHAVGRSMQPAETLHGRVRDRLGARRRRVVLQMMSASALVVALGATALVVTNDDRPRRLATSDDSLPSSVSPTTELPSTTIHGNAVVAGDAMNILVVGTDNGACIDPDSPYAPAFGDRSETGERSDTIMIVRLDPTSGRASILSFPRDLWVSIAGRGAPSRINSAFVRDDPSTLIDTIDLNFGIGVDHFVQIDFCGFKTIVDAVGGVAVPFEQPVRDEHTGLNVTEPGCRTLGGDEALAYVRSRHYQMFVNGVWIEDPSSDLGRVARQQDFVQRTMMTVIDHGFSDPGLARAVIGAVQDFLVVDTGLTIGRMLEIADELQSMASNVGHYQIDVQPQVIGNNSVLVPVMDSPAMQWIVATFGGLPVPAALSDTTVAASVPPDNLAGQLPPSVIC